MADVLNLAGYIYEGIRTDWSKGSVKGLTWTLGPTTATFLTNTFTVFIALCGVQLWTIIRYLLHRWGTPIDPEASTPHLGKEQIILRNAGSAIETAWRMLDLASSSRRSTGKPSLRAYTIGLTATIYAILLMAASIVSNNAISTASTNGHSAVLVRSRYCGMWNETYLNAVSNINVSNQEEYGMFTQYVSKRIQNVQSGLQYAQECYLSKATPTDMSSTCNILKNSTVGWRSSRTDSCPFESQMCHDTAATIVFDTGKIDSHDHLGINAKPEDRLKYQRVTTCAVLNGTSHIQGWNGTVENSRSVGFNRNSSMEPTLETAYAYYGSSIGRKTAWTYSYSNSASFYTYFSGDVATPYQVYVEAASPSSDSSDFNPIPELAQKAIDLTLVFLSYTGTYLGEINDPWFSAKTEQLFDNGNPLLTTRYGPDSAINTIDCTEQHNFCTSDKICTGFLGFDQVQDVDRFNAALGLSQNATFDRILRAIAESRLSLVIEALVKTTVPLLASRAVFPGNSGALVSGALPDDQWKLELEYWHSVAMAQLQRTMLQWATGNIAATPQYVSYLLPPTMPQDIWFCDNFMVSSITYQSFSVLAIILVVILGTLVITAGYFIESLTILFRRLSKTSIQKKHWDQDDLLELRRSTTKARRRRQEIFLVADEHKSSAPTTLSSDFNKF